MSWVYNSRRYNFDLPRKIQSLISKFNEKITDDVNNEEGEELQIRSEGGIANSLIKFCDTGITNLDNTLTATQVSTITSTPTYEPDGVYCKLLLDLDNPGFIPDRSGFEHHARMYGVPRMQHGMRYGYGYQSLETIFDGRTNYAQVTDHEDISIGWADFSLQFRFCPFDLATAAIHKQAVISKRESSDIWYSFGLYENGSCAFNLSASDNTKLRIETPPGTITATSYEDMQEDSLRYDVCVTYSYIDKVLKLYINNYLFDTMIAIPDDAVIPTQATTDMLIGRYADLPGAPVTLPATEETDPIRLFSRLFFGVIQQVKFWKGKVLTAQEVSNHYSNKVTISDIAYGNAAMSGFLVLT